MITYFEFLTHFLILLSIVEAFSSDGNNTIAAICQGDGLPQYVPDPYDCNKYFQCPLGTPQSCDPGLVWDPIATSCDYPWPTGHVNCTEKPIPKPEDSKDSLSGELQLSKHLSCCIILSNIFD